MIKRKRMVDETKPKVAPVHIPCLVLDSQGRILKYDDTAKRFSFVSWKDYTVFPNKKKAKHALWHQIGADHQAGIKDAANNYRIEEA
jgi:hypothetical protein